MKLNKTAAFTDIHWGCKGNTQLHNEDCDRYIDWFCQEVSTDPDIDNIVFLGDWFENRSAINISTLKYAYNGAKKINDLGLPVYFIVGNHDLYHRNTRDIHSVVNYAEFSNFKIIDKPTIIPNLGSGALMCPFLFHDEYADLKQYHDLNTWWGHFEFKGFVITGDNVVMPNGPDHNEHNHIRRIMSGHFHKRQTGGNVTYIGNTFPTNYGDAGDNKRGMVKYDHIMDEMYFLNWGDAPTYIKTKLSQVLENGDDILCKHARVKCLVDVVISFEESTLLREKFTEKFSLREFTMEESLDLQVALTENDTTVDWDVEELAGVDELVIRMLNDIDTPHIDTDILIDIYKNLKPAK